MLFLACESGLHAELGMLSGGHQESLKGGLGCFLLKLFGVGKKLYYGKKRGLEVIFWGRVRELGGYLEVRIN